MALVFSVSLMLILIMDVIFITLSILSLTQHWSTLYIVFIADSVRGHVAVEYPK